jgi:LacI family transcriptional regulator
VSFTFRQPHRVKESTRDTVLAAARTLGYLPSGNARGLARGRTGTLGIYSFDFYILDQPDLSDIGADAMPASGEDAPGGLMSANEDFRLFPLYVDEVQRGVALECWRRGYTLMVSGGSRPVDGSAADIAGKVDGLAVFPRSVPEDVLALISRRIPVVELSEPSHNDTLSHVTVDNTAGAHSATSHLIGTHGLRSLQFAGPADPSSDFQARFRGFQAALRSAGLPAPAEPLTFGTGTDRSAGDVVNRLLQSGTLPQGFVCALDEYALRLMDALAAAGIQVPAQVAVTGFDGIVAGRIRRPALTTVRQPMEQMGRVAAGILIDRFENPGKPPENRQLPVSLVLGESCGCAAG